MNQAVPEHIGFIMDGNRRWAKGNGLSTKNGHAAGADALAKIIQACEARGVKTITVYALSTENLKKRVASELKGIFGLLSSWLSKKTNYFQEHGVCLNFFGKIKELPTSIQRKIGKVTDVLKNNERIKLNILLNYGGRAEIVEAIQSLITEGKSAADINEEIIAQKLYTKDLADPDLIIRTGGEKRISNFLIWQISYAELYFTDTLWPDFDEAALDLALSEYAKRQRRYGGQTQPITKSNIL